MLSPSDALAKFDWALIRSTSERRESAKARVWASTMVCVPFGTWSATWYEKESKMS